ncbi:MAG: fibronectin type III domain-containing protein [Mogibacterium sp.]|nr:fibronectin type III domain-containing protein [Mogibacterium sp.]
MKTKFASRHLIWFLSLILVIGSVAVPQPSYALGSEAASDVSSMPVGGVDIPEMIRISDDIDVPEDLKVPVIPPQKKKARRSASVYYDSVITQGVSTVAYDSLQTDAQRQLYDLIDIAETRLMDTDFDVQSDTPITSYSLGVINYAELGITDVNDAFEAYVAYDRDHPGYYWMCPNVFHNSTYLFPYTYEEYSLGSTRQQINEMTDSGVKSYVDLARTETDTLEQVAIIHDKIVNDVDYAYYNNHYAVWNKWAHSVHGTFDPVHKAVVCEGYADTFALIMNYMGIPNYYIVGYGGNGGSGGNSKHAWNAVSVDGGETYLYMDLTWDDITDTSPYDDIADKGYTYKFFGMPASDFEALHVKDEVIVSGADWTYDTPGPYNDSFEGTYYKKGGFYYDGSTDLKAFASTVKAKALRAGDYVSVLAPTLDLLNEAAEAIDTSDYQTFTVTYEGKEYYWMPIKLREHVHDYRGPVYEWITKSEEARAYIVCMNPQCDQRVIEETHYYNSEVITEPTCTEDGLTRYTVTFWNETFGTHTEDVTVAALGHDWDEWVVVQEATDYEPGLKVRTCKNDPSHTEEEVIPPLKTSEPAEDTSGSESAVAPAAAQVQAQALPVEIVDLPTVKISKPKAAKKKVTVKWKKVSKKNKKIQGIEIQVAADPDFTQIVKSTTASKKKTSKVVKGLKSKTTYYVRVRAYKNAADGKHVSVWKTKKIKSK